MEQLLSSHALWTVARIEVKTLLRSWFFRILALLSLGLLGFVNLAMYTDVFHVPWMFRSISSGIPYFNVILLNLAQAVVASFLASDFLKRDRRLDSTDVVYMRSMSNGDYILGKTIGILLVFGGLNVAVLVIALVFNGVFSGVPVELRAYLFYPFLISLPTLVYILGVSFLLMAVIRNQAVTLIVLLGYIGTALIYLGPRVDLIYDYMAFHFPMLYSGFVGFGDTAGILLQRGMYLFFGVACILATVPLLRRLPQSRGMIRLSRVLTVVFAAAAVTLGGLYLGRLDHGTKLRDGMRSLDSRLAGEPRISMKRCHLDVEHHGSEIRCAARVTVRNETDRPIDYYRFSLNPALAVTSVEAGGGLPFERELHVVRITPPGPLAPGGIDSLVLSYRGGIDDAACYLDVDEKERGELNRVALYSVDKRYGFITPGYVLLTPETLWYPTPCVPFSPDRSIHHDGEFTVFSLDVSTDGALTALSQGAAVSPGGGRFVFSPETPLTGLTLCIGEYETRAVTVDSITYTIAMRTGHDAFTPHLSAIADTLPELIRELKGDYERRLELSYPFSRLTLLEVPAQFYGYPRLWTIHRETVQPEMVLLPERAANLPAADFRRFMDRPRRHGRQPGEQRTPREQQIRAFQGFVQSTIAGTIQRETGLRRGMGMMTANYNIFPGYFTLVTHLRSERLPILAVALESFILGRIVQPIDPVLKSFIGLTGEEKANLALGGQSLEEILADPKRRDIFSSVLESKGQYLFVMLQERIGGDEFRAYLAGFIARNRFKTVDTGYFMQDMGERYGFDLEPYIDRWYRGRELPSYLVGKVASYQVMDGDRTRFQVRFTATNTAPVDGFLRVTLRAGGRRRFGMVGGMDEATAERIISLQGDQTKECGMVVDFKPGMMLVSTLVSKNIPVGLQTDFAEFELDERARLFDGERVLETPLRVVEPGEIIVDNEDEGFDGGVKPTHGFLGLRFRQRPERDEEKYEGLRFWNLPDNRWVPVTHSDFFGAYVRSAVYTKAGDGGMPASWTAAIPESGTYEVYYYVSKIRRPWGRGSGDKLGQYHFGVAHDDGVDDVVLDIDEAENGWNYLGTYYLSSGEASVRLTNESNGLMVIADAVKWVKR
ncbi:MAG TPA: hypothetical protein VMX58_03515 [Patescibacteria group bacterium]|nr:hypothetical protein [Patescibacteria group bacterium]